MASMIRAILVSIALVFASAISAHAQLVVHEWGTFTSLQDETSRAIGGINTDDEPVPQFVHRAINLIQPADDPGKGIPPNNPEVTMRLETPVMYFHLPPGIKNQTVDVSVAFNGGWLTEYYPNADAIEPDLTSGDSIRNLTSNTIGHLRWPAVRIGVPGDAPQTNDPVWTSPRDVRCDAVRVGSESERFLFYRGVGHLDSPLCVSHVRDAVNDLAITNRSSLPDTDPHQLWLVDVRSDGRLAWRHADPTPVGFSADAIATVSSRFADADYGDGLSLRKELSDALVSRGLFCDEADALLNTWQQSYFKNPGLRLFFLTNPAWTDQVLPLHITRGAKITRVMVGRIELETQRQLDLMQEMADRPPLDLNISLKSAHPEYEQLGRFRNALLIDYLSRHPNPALQSELQRYGITAFTPQ